jgi:hypothetical protein
MKKNELKWLKQQIEKLPKSSYKAFHKYKEPQKEVQEDGSFVLREGYLEDHEVNHERRARRAYEKGGVKGLNLYFAQYGFKLKTPE